MSGFKGSSEYVAAKSSKKDRCRVLVGTVVQILISYHDLTREIIYKEGGHTFREFCFLQTNVRIVVHQIVRQLTLEVVLGDDFVSLYLHYQ